VKERPSKSAKDREVVEKYSILVRKNVALARWQPTAKKKPKVTRHGNREDYRSTRLDAEGLQKKRETR